MEGREEGEIVTQVEKTLRVMELVLVVFGQEQDKDNGVKDCFIVEVFVGHSDTTGRNPCEARRVIFSFLPFSSQFSSSVSDSDIGSFLSDL